QEICDQAAFIKEGKLIAVRQMNDIAQTLPKRVVISGAPASLKTALKALAGAKVTAASQQRLEVTFDGDINGLLKVIAKHKVADATSQEADLETVFLQYYK